MGASEGVKKWIFGSSVPFAEPAWCRGCPSPYYTDLHRQLQKAVRAWCDEHLAPNISDWEASGEVPAQLYRKLAQDGLLMPMAAGTDIPEAWASYPVIGGIPWQKWDGFCDYILIDEFTRAACIGVLSNLTAGLVIGLPPIRYFASEQLRQRLIPEILSGRKRVCLSITEPSGGSDVKNLETTAVKTTDGRYYIVNGTKKWITNGVYSDYFVTAVRTGGPGADGISLLVVPRTEGVRTRSMTTTSGSVSGTTFVEFDEVKVPVEYLLGKEGAGFKYILWNFNHERLWLAIQGHRCARICIEDAVRYALRRETFGKRLIEHPVIRYRLAHAIHSTEALNSWIESVIYQLGQLTREEGNTILGGTTALVKAQAGIVMGQAARIAIQIFGGLGLTRQGPGERVERIYREVPSITVPGGSEEILLDLGVREGLKLSERLANL